MKFTKPATAVALAVAATIVWACPGVASAGSDAPSQPQPVNLPLRVLAHRDHLRIGTAINSEALANDETYDQLAAQQFDSVTPENEMRWASVEPVQGVFNWAPADAIVAFARAHHQRVRGFTLVEGNDLPNWLTTGVFNGTITSTQLADLLHQHVTDEVKHFKGKIWQWDVVNEPFNEDGTLKHNIWFNALGPSYIADAFTWAHEADRHARLFLNDFNIETINAKSDAALALAQSLKAQDVPIGGVGFEAHEALQFGAVGADQLAQNMSRFAKSRLDTAITEADVRMILPTTPSLLASQASQFAQLVQGCRLVRRCTSFTVWEFTDKYSFVPGFFTRQGAATLYDENFNPKPAYAAVQQALVARETRGGAHP